MTIVVIIAAMSVALKTKIESLVRLCLYVLFVSLRLPFEKLIISYKFFLVNFTRLKPNVQSFVWNPTASVDMV